MATSPSLDENCTLLRARYQSTVNTLARLGLVIEPEKDELMHFVPQRLQGEQNPQRPLELGPQHVIQPSSTWRYLGFRLDSKLTFRAHVAYFAEQAWFRSSGVKTLLKPLVMAQNRVLRWITGAFCTTPTGAFAGVLPLHLHCKKLQERYFLRIHTLPASHSIRAAFPNVFERSPHAPFVRLSPHITETFDPLDEECRPGDRVRDLYEDRITMHLDHPPKSDKDALARWIENDLRPRIRAAHQDPDALVLFTDGSSFASSPTEAWLGSAAGFRAYHLGACTYHRAIQTGKAFAYDCEMIALSMAVAHGYLKSYHNVHIFCDSESSLKSVLHTVDGRMAAVNTCRILREWFERHADNHPHLHYCPSHSGIEENDAVDADVKWKARDKEPEYPPTYDGRYLTSYSYRRHIITDNVIGDWEDLANADPKKPVPAQTSRRTARSRRAVHPLHHRPRTTGAYRGRFRARHNEPAMCFAHEDERPLYHTREHVLFTCDRYVRRYQHSRLDDLLQSMDPFYEIQQFLQDNPTALSFEDLPGS
ncbi:hypothetical protein VTO73DRAFT_13934 [Trametes versicolor]